MITAVNAFLLHAHHDQTQFSLVNNTCFIILSLISSVLGSESLSSWTKIEKLVLVLLRVEFRQCDSRAHTISEPRYNSRKALVSRISPRAAWSNKSKENDLWDTVWRRQCAVLVNNRLTWSYEREEWLGQVASCLALLSSSIKWGQWYIDGSLRWNENM